jgi:hypothetical protein
MIYFPKLRDFDEQSQWSHKILRKSDERKAITCKKARETQQSSEVTKRQKFVVSLLLCHIALQFFLPYSHFITKVSTSINYQYFAL